MARSRATAERAAPRLGVFASVGLHVGLIVMLFVTFSKKIDLPGPESATVPVDLVTLADQTNIAPQTKAAEPPPDVPLVQPLPQPELAPPKFDISPDAKPDKKKKAEEDKKTVDDLIKRLADKQPPAKPGARDIKGVGAQNALTADLQSYLASQIYQCWSPPIGALNAASLIVVYDIRLKKDGTLADKPVLLSESAPAGTPRDAANQAAMRAIYQCQPYKLPLNRYSEWRYFSFRFNPRDLAGQ